MDLIHVCKKRLLIYYSTRSVHRHHNNLQSLWCQTCRQEKVLRLLFNFCFVFFSFPTRFLQILQFWNANYDNPYDASSPKDNIFHIVTSLNIAWYPMLKERNNETLTRDNLKFYYSLFLRAIFIFVCIQTFEADGTILYYYLYLNSSIW